MTKENRYFDDSLQIEPMNFVLFSKYRTMLFNLTSNAHSFKILDIYIMILGPSVFTSLPWVKHILKCFPWYRDQEKESKGCQHNVASEQESLGQQKSYKGH